MSAKGGFALGEKNEKWIMKEDIINKMDSHLSFPFPKRTLGTRVVERSANE